MKNKKTIMIAAAAVVSLCLICVVASLIYSRTPQGQADAVAREQTQTAQPTSTATSTKAPTGTPEPTATTGPTNTPRPSNTPAPTSTATPAPMPIILTGSGDGIVDLTKWDGPALIHIIGPSVEDNFIVHNYDASGERIDLLINTIGAYNGYLLIDISDQQTSRFAIESSGDWIIEVFPFVPEYVHTLELPGTYQGVGDDVFVLRGGEPDLAKFVAGPEETNFIVYSLGMSSGQELLVNEISPYSGTVIIPRDAFIITVESETTWSIEITVR